MSDDTLPNLTITRAQFAAIRATAPARGAMPAIYRAITGWRYNSRSLSPPPACMSGVLAGFCDAAEYADMLKVTTSPKWAEMIPYAAGTGRAHEDERAKIVEDWLFNDVLPLALPAADKAKIGDMWGEMIATRSTTVAWRITDSYHGLSFTDITEATIVAVQNRDGGSLLHAARAAAAAADSVAAVVGDTREVLAKIAAADLLERLVDASVKGWRIE